MITSIRRFLLLNLLLAIIVTTVLTTLGNYYLDKRDITSHLDLLLSQAALQFSALLGNDLNQRDLQGLQQNLDEIPLNANQIFQQFSPMYMAYKQRYQLQVWNKQGKLLLHSAKAPKAPFSDGKFGFSDITLKGKKWRVFTKMIPKTDAHIEVAEEYAGRTLLANKISQDDIYTLLLTYPLAGLLIWFIVGRGLRSIRRVADEVAHRVPNYLEPVKLESVPIEIKPLVDELNQLFYRLQDALEREKRFAGDAAHELRTPLAALKTQAQVALQTQNQQERNSILRNVIAGVDRCTHVVQQLLTLSRLVPEANTLADAISMNLTKLAQEVVAQIVPEALNKQIEIELIAEAKHAKILGSVTAISILIRNLVENAIRYTPSGGAVKVVIVQHKQQIFLRVIDNGPGIPAELRSRVFERFYRVLGNKSPGSGLGLAIVQQIAKLHNANINLGPGDAGKGLMVEIRFPVLKA